MSYLLVSGWNYHTAAIEIRERFSLSVADQKLALAILKNMPHIKEALILSTCNRIEVYAVVTDVPAGFCEIELFFSGIQAGGTDIVRPNFKLMHDDVVLHLFRVASGLDSLVLGDAQIISQIKHARQMALEGGALGPVLKQLFNSAINCGKRVRADTGIGRLAASVSSAAVDYGRKLLGCLHNKNVVVVGGGRMAQICLELLTSECTEGKVVSINRSKGRLSVFPKDILPAVLSADLPFEDRHRLVANADLVIVAASSPDYLLGKDELAKLLPGQGKKIFIIDISVPRNVDPVIAELEDVSLFHADELIGAYPDTGERDALVDEAERIVFDKLEEFKLWQDSLHVVPTLVALRRRFDSIRCEQMAKARLRSAGSQEFFCEPEIEKFGKAIVNQMLHEPTVRLKANAKHKNQQSAETIRGLFGIE